MIYNATARGSICDVFILVSPPMGTVPHPPPLACARIKGLLNSSICPPHIDRLCSCKHGHLFPHPCKDYSALPSFGKKRYRALCWCPKYFAAKTMRARTEACQISGTPSHFGLVWMLKGIFPSSILQETSQEEMR